MCRYSAMVGALAGLVTLSSAASAQTGNWYIAGSAGGGLLTDWSGNSTVENLATGQTAQSSDKIIFSPGVAATGAIGYHLPNGFRTEVEFGYLHFGVSSVSPYSNSALFPELRGTKLTSPSGGDANRFAGTANLYYDIPFKVLGGTPYLGAGAGYFYETSTAAVFARPSGGGSFTLFGGSGGNAVAQGEIGLSAPVTENLSLVPSYRYEYFAGSVLAHNANIFKLGLRYTFGASPATPIPTAYPAPVAVPAQAAARSFLVFFDWDKADVTERASQIIAQAAATSTRVQVTRIEVAGYTDTSGTPQYNKGLSIRRAQAVAEELIKDGVAKSAISIQGFGDTHLLVATGPGVREPQNRRVEIILR